MEERKEHFTPGTWTACEDGLIDKMVVGGDYDLIIDITHTNGQRNDADASLIAAAPEMYEALSDAVEKYGKPGGPWNVPSEPGSWIEKAKAALKKARGEE